MIEFIETFKVTVPKKITCGYLDIETDIISIPGFPKPGEVPINCVTFIDDERKISHTLILTTDDLPYTLESSPDYPRIQDMKNYFKNSMESFINNTDDFIENCHNLWDETYGAYEYRISFYDEEIRLLKELFDIIHEADLDFVEIWNLPFDLSNLIERIRFLGYSAEEIIIDRRFYPENELMDSIIQRNIVFHEDTNPLVHKRKHMVQTFTASVFIDPMLNYAGIRSQKGKLPSVKLNYIAEIELKDTKLDYTESGDIRHLPYNNLNLFILYNIKDVLLLVGIARKTKDIDTFYSMMYSNALLPGEIFTTTKLVENAIRLFAKDYVLGSNRAKLYKGKKTNFDKLIEDISSNYIDGEDEDFSLDDYSEDIDEDAKRDKFQGAFVMDPSHMSSSGFMLLGKESKYCHNYVVDEDIESEYPSAIIIMNSGNDTFVGKVFLENPDEIHVPEYKNMNFTPDERKNYKLDVSNFMLEVLSENDPLNMGKIFFNLPDISEIIKGFENE
jgi:hypothetical protein